MKKSNTILLALLLALVFLPGAVFLPAAALAQEGQTCGGIGNLQCPAGQACQFPEGQCNQPDLAGTCVAVPATCPEQGPPICGCNGTTYANECELLKAGVRPDRKGSCPGGKSEEHKANPCKTNAECEATQFCELAAGTCGDAGAGKCEDRGEVCPNIFKPVCGCDGETYANDCLRRVAGVSLRSDGDCPAPMTASR